MSVEFTTANGSVFENSDFRNHEQIIHCFDGATGLKAIIAIHSTILGPSLGGTRMWKYASEADALRDVLRLSRGMTYKNAISGLDLGGGKAVIIGDSMTTKTPELILAFARFVDRLGGNYITAEDVGISLADVELMATEIDHVRGTRASGLGDPSPYTAYGVFAGIKAAARAALGSDDLNGIHVCVQGIGQVGMSLARFLHAAGAKLTVADINTSAIDRAIEEFGALGVSPEEAHRVDCDIYAPCALGGALNETTIPEIRAKAVAGSANNQLQRPADGEKLRARGILYAPDYVINAGGVISIADVSAAPTEDRMYARVGRIDDVLTGIFARAAAEDKPPEAIADKMAEERISAVKR
ncbi:MAG: leucine dehydrogenase [Fimbriimonadaceae bacterium]|nr:leucine dehydrogenase [Alphaproteobacteria bacterium]